MRLFQRVDAQNWQKNNKFQIRKFSNFQRKNLSDLKQLEAEVKNAVA